MRVSEAAKWVLTSSEGDWVPATVANMAVDKAEDMPGLLRELTEKGLAEIGDVSGVCFSAWAGSPG